jgi:hypothetical protein
LGCGILNVGSAGSPFTSIHPAATISSTYAIIVLITDESVLAPNSNFSAFERPSAEFADRGLSDIAVKGI